MRIKPCSCCGRLPKITQCCRRRDDGLRTYIIGCPNFCTVLKTMPNDKHHIGANPYSPFYNKVSWLEFTPEAPDNNALYKLWNERLIENV